jgi:hypothetical protein
MNLITKSALVGFVASISLGPVSSFAQDAACSCVTAYRGPAGPIGSIRGVKGDVLVSQKAGYGSAKAGSVLNFGSRIVVGAKGAASVRVGDCNLDVPANSSLDISRVDNNICLKVEGPAQSAGAEPSGSAGGFGPPEGFFAGALLTSGLLAATQNDNSGVSQ